MTGGRWRHRRQEWEWRGRGGRRRHRRGSTVRSSLFFSGERGRAVETGAVFRGRTLSDDAAAAGKLSGAGIRAPAERTGVCERGNDVEVWVLDAGGQRCGGTDRATAINDDHGSRVMMLRKVSRTRLVAQSIALTLFSAWLVRAQTASAGRGAAPGAGYTISGTIVNSLDGAPLGQSRVSLIDTRDPRRAASIITSESGRFEFSELSAGKFALEGAKRGFLEAGYQQHERFSTAIVTGAGFKTQGLLVRLTPMSLLSGRVIDEFGDPVRNARVVLYVESHRGGLNR